MKILTTGKLRRKGRDALHAIESGRDESDRSCKQPGLPAGVSVPGERNSFQIIGPPHTGRTRQGFGQRSNSPRDVVCRGARHLNTPHFPRARAVALAFAFVLIATPASAQAQDEDAGQLALRLYLQAGSYHFDRSEYEFTNFTPGLAIEAGRNFIAAAGAYRNSVRALSLYGALGYRPFVRSPIRPFAALGLVWGYHRGDPDPDGVEVDVPPIIPLPVLGVDVGITNRIAVRAKALYPVVAAGVVLKLFNTARQPD